MNALKTIWKYLPIALILALGATIFFTQSCHKSAIEKLMKNQQATHEKQLKEFERLDKEKDARLAEIESEYEKKLQKLEEHYVGLLVSLKKNRAKMATAYIKLPPDKLTKKLTNEFGIGAGR